MSLEERKILEKTQKNLAFKRASIVSWFLKIEVNHGSRSLSQVVPFSRVKSKSA